ncbi:prion-inhibition and propagation-domain-containing protein [Aspergillus karnatakaensis]|uniref:prion-inhibition and propagation domain-containing protein n=1 Tax=Aspergillus karnatakaensis TaxID=1810916 RepID=UPI003CCCA6B6
MELAGLVLSAVALFDSCLKGYQLVSDIKGLGQDSAILLCRLQIEEKRLTIWGRTVGLAEETCRLPADELDTILTVLKEIKSITQEAAELKKRYGASSDSDRGSSDEVVEYIQSSAVLLDLRRRIDAKAQSSRPSWKAGLRFMFDRKNFEKLVVDLRELNNGLYALLQAPQRMSSMHDFSEVCLLSSASDDARKLATIRDASQSTYDTLSRTVDQRLHLLHLQDYSPEVLKGSSKCIPLKKLSMVETRTTGNRSIALLNDEATLIEWRAYTDDENNHEVVGILEERIAGLSVLLGQTPKPKEFQVLDCVGYCHDELEKRFGIIYNLPTLDPDFIPEIVSLYDLIHPSTGAEKIFPSLNDRFQLSNTLANSLLQLHSTKWLHRNLRSSHILFLKTGKNMVWFHEPYICGFEYSRPDDINAISLPLRPGEVEVEYQHPDLAEYPRVGYCREYDAYSLGIILAEIGFWRPIADFRKPTYTPKRNHRRLLEYQLSGDLAHRMGVRYEQAVKLLLTEKAYEGVTEGEQLVAFLDNVVTKVDLRCLA